MRSETEELLRERQRKILTRNELNQLRLAIFGDFEERGLPVAMLKEWNLELDEHLRLRSLITSTEAYRLIDALEVRCRKYLRPGRATSIAVSEKPGKKRPHRTM